MTRFEPMVTASGRAHGCINTVASSCEDNDFKYMKGDQKEKAKALKKEEQRIVKARYINHRGPNEVLEKPYMRWAGEPITMWRLIDGETYELPYGFIKEINEENQGLPRRSDILDANGVPTVKDGKAERIHELVPVGFN
jgi:hypothetical protein